MSLPNNLGRLSAGLTADASLNIGVGVTPSGTYKFEVGTTSKFTGVATFGSTLSNGTYTYTLPSATGTLALTSALSGYLPLTGGTLTGALGGTTASFSSSVTSSTITLNGTGNFLNAAPSTGTNPSYGSLTNTGGSVIWGLENNSGGAILTGTAAYSASFGTQNSTSLNLGTNGISRLTIASTGAATFSSQTSIPSIRLYSGATSLGYFIKASDWGGSGSNPSFAAEGTLGLNFYVNGSSATALAIAYTGAATFSSSVTAKGTGNYNGFIADNSSSATIGGGYFSAYSFGVQRAIFGVAGSISGTTDNNAGIFAEGGLGIKFFVNGSATASHIMTSGGNVLINTTTDAGYKLDVNGTGRFTVTTNKSVATYTPSSWTGISDYVSSGVGWQFTRPNDGVFAHAIFTFNGTSTNNLAISSRSDLVIATGGGLGASDERMRITSGGVLDMSNNSTTFSIGSISGKNRIQWDSGTEFAFLNTSNQYAPTAASAFNVRSDYRLKEDLKEVNGLQKVLSIKTYDFKWIDSKLRQDGVLAHELQEILPYAVSGTKDQLREDGTIYPQGVDYGKIVPVLIKAIQELSAQIKELQSQINK